MLGLISAALSSLVYVPAPTIPHPLSPIPPGGGPRAPFPNSGW